MQACVLRSATRSSILTGWNKATPAWSRPRRFAESGPCASAPPAHRPLVGRTRVGSWNPNPKGAHMKHLRGGLPVLGGATFGLPSRSS